MAQKILVKRGLKLDLPTLAEGEVAFCTDTKEYFIGSSTGNVKLANFSDISVSGGGYAVDTYKTQPIGELYDPPSGYTAWLPSGLWYDKNKNLYLMFIYGTDSHVNSTNGQYMNFATIDPDTLKAIQKPTPMIMVDSNGNAITGTGKFPNGVRSDDQIISTTFIILNDGTYFMLGKDTANYYRLTSTDGIHWVNQGIPTWNGGTITPASPALDNVWGTYKSSSGRLFAGFGAKGAGKLIYSDDNGVSWTILQLTYDKPVSTITPREPMFIELSPNKIMALWRKSGAGLTYGTTGGAVDPAMISFSTDNGLTWSKIVDSTTITSMNANSAASIVHDGIVEVFACSRLFTTDQAINTGQYGAIGHYVATIDNALNDKFTYLGNVVYSNTTDSNDFSCPTIAKDKKNRLLLGYFDLSSMRFDGAINHFFVRGNLGDLSYSFKDGKAAPNFGYSGKYIEYLVSNLNAKITSLQNLVSQIPVSSGANPVKEPKGRLIWSKTYNSQYEKILANTSTDFTGNMFWANTGSGYNQLKTDADGNTYSWNANNWAYAFIPTKANFAMYFRGTISNNSSKPIVGFNIGGVYYTIDVSGLSTISANIHEYQIEYWNGTMKAYVDGNEMKVITMASVDSATVTNITNVIGAIDSAKKYVVQTGGGNGSNIYEVRYGEWN